MERGNGLLGRICSIGLGMVAVWTMGHGVVEAQSTPMGVQFQVNVATTGPQQDPRADGDGQGNYVVTWIDPPSILGRQQFADGSLGPELVLIDPTFFTQFDVALSSSGEFVVAVIQDERVEAHRFDGSGTSLGTPIVVSEDLGLDYRDAAVAAQGGGEFLVVWATDLGTDQDIFARRLGAGGVLLGDVFQVNDYTTGGQGETAVAAIEGGDFVVTWLSAQSPGNDDDFTSIQARAFDSMGQPISGQFQVNTATVGRQSNPAVDLLQDGSFAVAWLDRVGELPDQDGGIAMQRATVDGQLLGDSIQVNTYTPGFQRFPDIAALDDGRFIVAWESFGSPEEDSLGTSILGRVFDSSGIPVGDDFQVNSFTRAGQIVPSIAGGPGSTWLATWESDGSPGDDNSFESIQGLLLGPFTPNLFADGFESGDVTSWSDAQPSPGLLAPTH